MTSYRALLSYLALVSAINFTGMAVAQVQEDSTLWNKLLFLENTNQKVNRVIDLEHGSCQFVESKNNGVIISLTTASKTLAYLVRDMEPSTRKPTYSLHLHSDLKQESISAPSYVVGRDARVVLDKQGKALLFNSSFKSELIAGSWRTHNLEQNSKATPLQKKEGIPLWVKRASSSSSFTRDDSVFVVYNAGEFGSGIIQYQPADCRWTRIYDSNYDDFLGLISAAVDSDNRIWILTSTALRCLESPNKSFTATKLEKDWTWPTSITSDAEGELFLASPNGYLFVMRNDKLELLTKISPKEVGHNEVLSIYSGKDNLVIQWDDYTFSILDLKSHKLTAVKQLEDVFRL